MGLALEPPADRSRSGLRTKYQPVGSCRGVAQKRRERGPIRNQACPPRSFPHVDKERLMAAVMIGIDPHKGSHTAVAIRRAGGAGWASCGCGLQRPRPSGLWPLGSALAGADLGESRALAAWGYLLAQQLVGPLGELVLDVQPKLGARVRLLARPGRRARTTPTTPGPSRSRRCAAAAPRRVNGADENHAAVLKVWSKRHRDLGRGTHPGRLPVHAVSCCELIPGGISKEITAAQAAQRPGGGPSRPRCHWPPCPPASSPPESPR